MAGGSNATRPVLYLLPGLLCDASTFEAQRAALSDSMTSMAGRVFADAPDRFSVCGFSMGGRVALRMFAMAPERIERLCLLDTGVTPPAEGEAASRQVLVDLAYAEGMNAVCDAWLPPMVHPARRGDAAFMAPLRAMVCSATPDIFARQISALLTRPDARPFLPTIKCPTLVGVGRQDEWSTVAQHEDIARAIPGATLTVIEDSGHFTPVEQPDVLTDALRRWMRL
jgi:pimeloyl-ACP methyl ester carboxylesterase